jgi:D-inositol-3-phosphate glycosyltransferase
MEPERRLILGMGAIEHASHFGWDTTARGMLDVYDRVLSQGQNARLNLAQ